MPDNLNIPGLPAVPKTLPLELQRMLEPMRELLLVLAASNNPVIQQSLTDLGLVNEEGAANVPATDFTPPPAPVNLQAAGALAVVILEWEPGSTDNIAYTEVWRAQENDFSLAVPVGSSPGNLYTDNIGSGATRFYWTRHVSKAGIPGPFNAQLGTSGTTGSNPQYLIDVLASDPPEGYNRFLYTLEEDTIVNGVLVPAGTYINTAYIATASIGNAQIADAAIDQAKIAEAAIGAAQIQDLAVTDAHIAELTATKIKSGLLGVDVVITVGETAGGLPALELNGDGEVISNGANGEFSRLWSGDVEVWKNVPEVGPVMYKALSRIETGVAENDTVVTIPGYFDEQPKIIVSPFSVQLYNAALAAQDQVLNCQALDVEETETGSMVWRFKPVASLTLAAANGSRIINEDSQTQTGAWTSQQYTTPANCVKINPSIYLASNRGTGSSTFYYRTVRWRVEYWDGTTWVPGAWKTHDLAASVNAGVLSNAEFVFPSTNTWTFRIYCEASDTGGTFGSTEYETGTVQASRSSSVERSIASPSTGGSVSDGFTYSLSNPVPSGWTATGASYSYRYSYYLERNATTGTSAAVSASGGTSHSQSGLGSSGDFGLSSQLTRNFSGSWSTNAISASLSAVGSNVGISRAKFKIHSATATISIRRPKPNSTTAANTFRVDSYNYELTAAEKLADGTLNWIALGR